MRDRTLLDTILEPGGVSVLFQPIYEVSGEQPRLHALECLVRGPRGTNMEPADVLFEYVRRKREESLVDRICVATALAEGSRLPGAPHLSVNVHASTLGRDHDFVTFIGDVASRNGIVPSRLTVEIVEHAPPWDGPSFMRALEGLRRMGIQIALDDIGLGQSNYRMLIDCRPEYFKIDRYLVNGSENDFYRQAVLDSVSQLARRFGSQAIAEGIENLAELEVVLASGVTLMQGYLLSKPLSATRIMETNLLQTVVLPGLETAGVKLPMSTITH